jgi:hypothetical protein
MKKITTLFISLVILFTLFLVACGGNNSISINDGVYWPQGENAYWSSLEFKDGTVTSTTFRDADGNLEMMYINNTGAYTLKYDRSRNSYVLTWLRGEYTTVFFPLLNTETKEENANPKEEFEWIVEIVDENTIRFQGVLGTYVRNP